jgi:hypothetical protein
MVVENITSTINNTHTNDNQIVLPPLTTTQIPPLLPSPQSKEAELSDSEKIKFLIDNAYTSDNAVISTNNASCIKKIESNLHDIVAQLL